MLPLVSVIVPVYNVKPYLREALDSVIHQTYQNLEIILVDDGSTDGSGEICDHYQHKDNRIRVIHQNNKGLSAARNAGLDMMQGEIVAFLDPDDAYFLGFIEKMYRKMHASQADIVICGFHFCYTADRMSMENCRTSYLISDETLTSISALNCLIDSKIADNVWNRLYCSRIFDHLRFPEGHVYEDVLLSPLIFENANTILTISNALIFHRKRPQSITTTNSEKNICDMLYARHMRAKYISSKIPKWFSKDQRQQYNERCLIFYILQYFRLIAVSNASSSKIILRKEISKFRSEIKGYSYKTRLKYHLFMVNPYLCFVLTKIHGFLVRLARRIKTILLFNRDNNQP